MEPNVAKANTLPNVGVCLINSDNLVARISKNNILEVAAGPELITQCPIRPGGSYTYGVRFRISWVRAIVYGALVFHQKEAYSYPFPKPNRDFVGEWWNANPLAVIREAMKLEELQMFLMHIPSMVNLVISISAPAQVAPIFSLDDISKENSEMALGMPDPLSVDQLLESVMKSTQQVGRMLVCNAPNVFHVNGQWNEHATQHMKILESNCIEYTKSSGRKTSIKKYGQTTSAQTKSIGVPSLDTHHAES